VCDLEAIGARHRYSRESVCFSISRAYKLVFFFIQFFFFFAARGGWRLVLVENTFPKEKVTVFFSRLERFSPSWRRLVACARQYGQT
jgi:hypothetical protein